MAQQLTGRAGGALNPARTGARQEERRIFFRLTTLELRRSLVSWDLAVVCVIIALPAVQGLVQASSYRLWDNFDLFTLMLTDWLPLLFPMLVTAIALPRFAGELTHGFVRPVLPRVRLSTYIGARIVSAAVLTFCAFLLAVTLTWVVAFVVNAGHGVVEVHPPQAGETVHPVADRTTFSPLYAVSPALFGAVLAVWVGVNGALWSVIGALSVLLVGNRFLALAAPTVLYVGIEVAVAYARFEGFGLAGSTFQSNIIQQPAWYPFIQFVALAAATFGVARAVRAHGYETAGLG